MIFRRCLQFTITWPKFTANKVMVIDDGTQDVVVVTGSYNFTRSAQRMNSENLLLIRGNLALAHRFRQNWERHRADAIAFRPAGVP